ncbi:hypothetical protein N9A72_00645 [bacterium]|nr:hypothetical protein [bacterium]
MIKKIIISGVLIIVFCCWSWNFVAGGGLQNYLDKHPGFKWTPKIQYYLGELYFSFRKFAKATECFERIMERYSKETNKLVEVHYKLICCYEKTLAQKKAEEEIKLFLERYPENEYTLLVKKKLEILGKW